MTNLEFACWVIGHQNLHVFFHTLLKQTTVSLTLKVTFAYSIDRFVDCGGLITFSDFQLFKIIANRLTVVIVLWIPESDLISKQINKYWPD